MDLAGNLETVRRRIAAAANRAGRASGDVTLIAVTKSVDAAVTAGLIGLGVAEIAENRQQAAAAKFPNVPGITGVRRHFIGPLQRNKVKRVLELFDCIHSVESLKLADEISKRAVEAGKVVDVFVEVNVSRESNKGGFEPDSVAAALPEIRGLPGLNVLGLMCMAPYDDDPEAARPHFKALAAHAWPGAALSMGMSGDFEVAIEEGATHVRVGSALFEE